MDRFESLATGLDLVCTVSEVNLVPLDLPPDLGDTSRLYYAELSRPGMGVPPVGLVYSLRTFRLPNEPPRCSDVLFYVAVQCLEIDRSGRTLSAWLRMIGSEEDNPAGAAVFARQVTFNTQIRVLFGADGYERLVEAYWAECHAAE
jgi:hypothetical protein